MRKSTLGMTDFRTLKGEWLRRSIAVIAIAVTVYYLYWRVTETFNPNAIVFSWALYIAEFFGFITTSLFYFTVWKPVKRTSPPPLKGRSVDVLIPTKDEPVSILRKTLLACNDLKYPHRTLVLDDGGRAQVRALCEELGTVYLAREGNEDAKAGNLNFGLEQSEAEFIAVFDADHVPLPRFIDRLIGYFRDDAVGFVQTPQEFYNIDSFQHRADYEKKYVWAEQSLFYYLIQPGRDHWNAAYFVGSCALLRRKALDDIGGFQGGSITEDMMTSIRLQGKGWSSVYHSENLAYGIAAETIHPFHIQRRRWGLGGWQVFFKRNPLFMRGLSLPQRLCYLASLIYPIEGFQKLVFYITPPIALFTGILPMRALDINYLLHFIPYYAISIYAFNEMGRGFGGNLLLEQFSMGKFITYIRSFGALFLPRRLRGFKVTPKGSGTGTPQALLAPQALVCILSVSAIAWALAGLLAGRRGDEFIIAVNSLWALYNCGLGLAIILYARRKFVQRREEFRIPDSVPVFYSFVSEGRKVRRLAVADDLTRKGASLVSTGPLPAGRDISLEIAVPRIKLAAKGRVVQGRTIALNGYVLTRAGLTFEEFETGPSDDLTRYLHESAVSKFLLEYSTRYKTYIERYLAAPSEMKGRARRGPAYLPAVIMSGDGRPSFGVIKNISRSGMLLAARDYLEPGKPLTVQVIIDTDIIPVNGTVSRNYRFMSEDFPEFLAGVKFSEPRPDGVDHILRVAEKIGGLL